MRGGEKRREEERGGKGSKSKGKGVDEYRERRRCAREGRDSSRGRRSNTFMDTDRLTQAD